MKIMRKFKEDIDDKSKVKVYVGTYAKYSNGSIDGKWLTPSDYDTYDDFIDACKKLHKDEKQPELMFQDYDNYPNGSEMSFTKKDFNYAKVHDGMDEPEAFEKWYDNYGKYNDYDDADELETAFNDAYAGDYDSDGDLARELVDAIGIENLDRDTLESYFDYDSYGRDLVINDYNEINGHYFYNR